MFPVKQSLLWFLCREHPVPLLHTRWTTATGVRADEHKGRNPAPTKACGAPWPHAQRPVSRAGLSLLDAAFSQEVVIPSCV